MLIVIFAFLTYQAMPMFIQLRSLYETRERHARIYSWQVFITSSFSVELLWNMVAGLIMFFPFYYLIGMNGNAIGSGTQTERGGLMFLLFQEFMIYATSFTVMVVASVETAEIGAVIALLLFTFSMVFCG